MTRLTEVEKFARRLARYRTRRRKKKAEMKAEGRAPRRSLSPGDRKRVLKKTGRRCHMCGGKITRDWHADHVLAHSTGGKHHVDNYLPAHRLCNSYRWDYSEKEFQIILKLGVWVRTQIEKQTPLGTDVAERFLAHESQRAKRSMMSEGGEVSV
ncbi:MAG TPA: HNH endonuclease [Gemmatimonadota bacterium]|nr:HNH endonuclease [Gemmatimonadota bacterium]